MSRLSFITSKGNIKEQTRKELQARYAADYKAAKREDKAFNRGRDGVNRVTMDVFPITTMPAVRWDTLNVRRYNTMDRAAERARQEIAEDIDSLRRDAEAMTTPVRRGLDYRGIGESAAGGARSSLSRIA